MPLTESDLTYEEMKRIQQDRRQVCAECGGQLSLAWGGSHGYDSNILRCSVDIKHTGYVKHRQETVFPGSHVGGIPIKEYRKLEKEKGTMTAQSLVPYSSSQALTEASATAIVNTLWGDAPAIEKEKAVALCVHYQLNPLMRHVYLVGYNKKDERGKVIGTDWSIQVGIQANRLIASRNKTRPFGYAHDTPRLMTDEEELRYYKVADTKKVRAITILVDKDGLEARGISQIDRSANIKGQDKGNSHENMACIRSERAALDRMCPGEMPQNVETIDAEYEVLDTSTGEITEVSTVSDEEVKGTPFTLNNARERHNPDDDLSGEDTHVEEPQADDPNRPVTSDEIVSLKALLMSVYVDPGDPEDIQIYHRRNAQRSLGAWCVAQGWDLASRNDKKVANLADLTYSELLKVTDAVGAKLI